MSGCVADRTEQRIASRRPRRRAPATTTAPVPRSARPPARAGLLEDRTPLDESIKQTLPDLRFVRRRANGVQLSCLDFRQRLGGSSTHSFVFVLFLHCCQDRYGSVGIGADQAQEADGILADAGILVLDRPAPQPTCAGAAPVTVTGVGRVPVPRGSGRGLGRHGSGGSGRGRPGAGRGRRTRCGRERLYIWTGERESVTDHTERATVDTPVRPCGVGSGHRFEEVIELSPDSRRTGNSRRPSYRTDHRRGGGLVHAWREWCS